MKQEKIDRSKNGLKTDAGSLGLTGDLKFTAYALLFWSAILLLPSD